MHVDRLHHEAANKPVNTVTTSAIHGVGHPASVDMLTAKHYRQQCLQQIISILKKNQDKPREIGSESEERLVPFDLHTLLYKLNKVRTSGIQPKTKSEENIVTSGIDTANNVQETVKKKM